MAATATAVRAYQTFAGNHLKKLYTVAMDSSYPTGGEDIDLSSDFAVIDFAYFVNDQVDSSLRFSAVPDSTNHVLVKSYDEANAESAAATNLAGITNLKMVVEGIPVGGVSSGSEV